MKPSEVAELVKANAHSESILDRLLALFRRTHDWGLRASIADNLPRFRVAKRKIASFLLDRLILEIHFSRRRCMHGKIVKNIVRNGIVSRYAAYAFYVCSRHPRCSVRRPAKRALRLFSAQNAGGDSR